MPYSCPVHVDRSAHRETINACSALKLTSEKEPSVNPGISLSIVDAFASRPFSGNQAAVCVLKQPVSDDWLQAFALEMNFSETAYLWELPEDPEADFHLRWFTPGYEVDLCGHATLASAHRIWFEDDGKLGKAAQKSELKFRSRSGILTARRRDESEIELDFPATPSEPGELPEGLIEALAPNRPEELASRIQYRGNTAFDAFLQLDSSAALHALAPDFVALKRIKTRGIIATAQASEQERADGIDFVSRFFAPTAGIDEDPVTGSAHCALAPFWTERLSGEAIAERRGEMVGFQASKRGGLVRVQVKGERVLLRGKAISIVTGSLQTQPS